MTACDCDTIGIKHSCFLHGDYGYTILHKFACPALVAGEQSDSDQGCPKCKIELETGEEVT